MDEHTDQALDGQQKPDQPDDQPDRDPALQVNGQAVPPRSDRSRWRGWMAAAQDGDGAAYQALLESLVPELRRFVRGRLRDALESEDVVQNVLFALHRARHTYRPERPFEPWLWTIARNAVVDAQRSRSARLQRESPLDLSPEPVAPASTASSDRGHVIQKLSAELHRALEQIPRSQREAVELIQLQELSIAEAAARAGTTTGAMKVRAHRGYRALRKILTRVYSA